MLLKSYQEKTLERLDTWLDSLKKGRQAWETADKALGDNNLAVFRVLNRHLKNYPVTAWNDLREQGVLPAVFKDGSMETPDYIVRTAASGDPIPHVCLKVPTGGGKTLLGIAALERIKQDTGFVLWTVPTKAIYEQTVKAFRTREHPYRVMLERISGGKVKLLEKTNQFTKWDIESHLCVMMLMLPSVNRQKGRNFLKIFRDSSQYTSFFPEPDDVVANKKLIERYPDLDTNADGRQVRQSLVNSLKLIRPTVILDEAHKAYGPNDNNNREFVQSVNRLNPRFVLELSATPRIGISNILADISGAELQAEEMIKLPIEIHSFENSDWKHTLAEAKEKRDQLEQAAHQLRQRENRYIRPIALVRVQRTGKDQRLPGKIHAEDARDYLVQNLAVPKDHIRIHSSEQKELAGEDLLAEDNAVRWIITKDALKEGWDCSFAYILALLDNTTATTAMTQMIGRVMRQPQAHRVDGSDMLNRCYVYCYNRDVGEAVEGVKAGLEKEGLTGLTDAIRGHGGEDSSEPVTVKPRNRYMKRKIFLPQVLHREKTGWRPLDYDRDILSAVDWKGIDGGKAVSLKDEDTIREIKITIDIQGQSDVSEDHFAGNDTLTLDYFVRRLVDLVPNPWQAARIVEGFLGKHRDQKHADSMLLNNRIYLSEILRRRVQHDLDGKAEAVFREKIGQNGIRFHLATDERLDYRLGKSFEVYVSDQERTLQGKRGTQIQRSLFEPVFESDFNNLEKNFALYLEESNAIYWWHRIAARQAYSLQGWRRQRVYPDFVACRNKDGRLLILETKGIHLKGNEDTTYKEKLLDALEKTYAAALDRGEMTIREPEASLRMMFEDTWKEDMKNLISDNS